MYQHAAILAREMCAATGIGWVPLGTLAAKMSMCQLMAELIIIVVAIVVIFVVAIMSI